MTDAPSASTWRRFDVAFAPLLGAVATLGFAPISFWPAAVLALAGLFGLCVSCSWKRAALLGWLFGVTHFGTGVYWVFISTHVYGGAPFWLGVTLAAVLFAYLAIYVAMVCALGTWLQAWRSRFGWLLVPAAWMLAELLRGWVYSGFPWLSLGYVALDTPAERFAPLVGTHGLSFIYALSAYALLRSAWARGATRPAALMAALSPLAGSLLPAPETWTHDAAPALRVAVVQGNVPQDEKWERGRGAEIMQRYRAMTLAADADIVAWPEVVPNRPLDLVEDYFAELDARMKERDAALLAGVLIRGTREDEIYNSILALGSAEGRYDKQHLVPFGEYFPIPDWLRPVMDVLGTPYSDFSRGSSRHEPITARGQTLGISICFEDVFGSEFARESRGASLLVNATNDAWFAGSSAPHQHLGIARFRALENGRWLVRATNTGISALIGPDGRLAVRSQQYATELLSGQVTPRGGLTPYARYRDPPLWWAAACILLVGFMLHMKKFR
ncbi:MAG: Apolipoprotein N-acyltransferase [Panacagrimonas sp.]|jgi:apolipoprotein N-acyltransferase|nr:apolipoprotein N-acyltransferase [Panacagrimonas sp.]MCC2655417.1 Apolipoprotein N-acyltransferase [Panacagrimonas sp.]